MADRTNSPDDRIDALVRSYLQEDSGRVDVERNLAAIKERLKNPAAVTRLDAPRTVFFRRRRLGISVAAASLVSLALYVVFHRSPVSAFAVVSAAHDAITPGSDRCYRVEIDATPQWFARHPFLRHGQAAIVWTCGDRFRVSGERKGDPFVWGQDERGRVWFAGSDNRGLIYNRAEVPPMVRAARSWLNLDVAQLSNRLLQHFDLEFDSAGPAHPAGSVVIRGTIKPGHDNKRQVSTVRLTVERDTNVIRQLQLSQGEQSPQATITFTLIDARQQPDASYQLAAHVRSDAEILARDEGDARMELLREWITP